MSLRPSKPQQVPNEALRELLLRQRKVITYISVELLIVLGLFRIGDGFNLFKDLHIPNVLLTSVALIAFGVVFTWMLRLARYDLNPKDEYEKLQDYKAKARAYDFINLGVVLIIVLLNQPGRLSIDGLLLVLIGVGLYITTKTNAK